MDTIREIILSGTAYERGWQHGEALRTEINDFLNDSCARINLIRELPLEAGLMSSLIGQHATVIEQELPEIAEELKGLAAGADISYEHAVLLQVRVELMAYNERDILEGDCSTLAFKRDDHTIITGQTIDLPGNMASLGCIFRILPENEDDPEILMYGFAGLLGYMGMNSTGLSVNINMVVSDDWHPGVSPYLLVRHMLTLRSTDECLDALEKIKRSSSRSFLLSDKNGLVNAECTGNEVRTNAGDLLFHTNHYLDEELKKKDRIHFLFKNSSIKRLALLQKLLPANTEDITPAMLFDIFSDHSLYPVGICAHSEGNIRRSETVGAVVMEPAKFVLHARKGNTCVAITHTFKLTNQHIVTRRHYSRVTK
ncbi:MAG: C45 family peptidase [Ferruginibacter sp.]